MLKMLNEKEQKVAMDYKCVLCDYNTSRKNNYDKHIKTLKHYMLTNANEKEQKVAKYKCLNCGKEYLHQPSLSRHKNTCKSSTEIIVKNEEISNINDINDISNISDKELINKLLNQNIQLTETIKEQSETMKEQSETMKEQSATMKEMIPKLGNTTNNNISLITYLNTECKDAMNLTDFINNIKHTLQDALFTIDNGLVNGLTKALIDNLNQLPKIQRPIWCADVKRKKNIIKDDNKWIEDKENKKIKLALTNIQQKQE